jgi:peptidoglycan/LPS O-acetylase OafA/YrhL
VLPSEGAISTTSAKPVVAFLFFVQNLAVSHQILGPLGVTWSLAIEEQFYFVWPFLVWLLPRRAVQWISLGIFLVSIILRLYLQALASHVSMYTNTFTRLDGLAVGSFLAVWLRDTSSALVRSAAMSLFPISMLLTIVLRHSSTRYAPIALMFGSVLCLSLFQNLKNSFLQYTGKISFGLYLMHLIAFDIARQEHVARWYASGLPGDITFLIVGFSLSYLLATASWYFFESRFLLLKSRFDSRRTEAKGTMQRDPLTTYLDTVNVQQIE